MAQMTYLFLLSLFCIKKLLINIAAFTYLHLVYNFFRKISKHNKASIVLYWQSIINYDWTKKMQSVTPISSKCIDLATKIQQMPMFPTWIEMLIYCYSTQLMTAINKALHRSSRITIVIKSHYSNNFLIIRCQIFRSSI